MKKALNITLRELLSDVLQSENGSSSSTESDNDNVSVLDPTDWTFKKNELPLDIAVAYPHLSVDGLTIVSLTDFSLT